MKHVKLCLFFFWVGAILSAQNTTSSAAQKATTVYVEGDTSTRSTGGKITELDIGMLVASGESVITKKNGRADLELANKSLISIKPNTVFTLGEVEQGGEKQSVFTTAVGEVSYRFNKMTGRGPVIRTASSTAGLRGTELTVYAGMDGSSLVAVTKGAVEVSSQGKSVQLAANEAVEVQPGRVPGEKFTWLGKEKNFSTWNNGKEAAFLQDPVGALKKVAGELSLLQADLEKAAAQLAIADAETDRVYAELKQAVKDKDDVLAEKLRTEMIAGVGDQRRIIFLNTRYYALSYLSLRRYVVGGMYVQMKSRFIKQGGAVYDEFMAVYQDILANYERVVCPRLVEADF